MQPLRVLILGGTTEASALARALADDPRFAAVLSLAGRTADPVSAPIPRRVGGFGGADGLAAHLTEHRIDALVDATHPFAAAISRNAAAASAIAGVPLLAIRRLAWTPEAGDRWLAAPTLGAAATALGPLPRRALLTVGRQELAPFAAAPWHDYLVRSVDPPEPALLPPRAVAIAARGPFALAGELRLLARHRVQVVVTKNSGGSATAAKLMAARNLGITVVMVDRPASFPDVASVAAVPDALAWLHQAAAARRGV